jgi:hypothetical protein
MVQVSVGEKTWPDGCRTSATTTPEEHAQCDESIARYRVALALQDAGKGLISVDRQRQGRLGLDDD